MTRKIRFLKTTSFALLIAFASLYGLWRTAGLTSFQFFGEIYSHVPTTEKVIALTFDDGPNPANTPELLSILDRYNARATFFMVGKNIEQNRELASLVLSKGHQIGNHSYSHPRMLLKSPSFTRLEIERTDQLIREIGFRGEILFRAPYGKKLFVLPYVLSKMNKKNIMWDVESEDTETQDVRALTDRTIPRVKPGSVILFHDGGARKPGTLAAVETLLSTKVSQGYRFITVSELLSTATDGNLKEHLK